MPNLTGILAGRAFAVVGGVATSLYMPARQTDDVDILVKEADYGAVSRALEEHGAERLGQLRLGGSLGVMGFAWRLADGSALDILISGASWAREALARPNRDLNGLPIVALPYLVLLKIDAARGVDVGDLSRMLGLASDEDLEEVRRVVRVHLRDAADDLESLIYVGRLELRPPDDAAPPPH